jgi:hypothetical protein
MCRFDRDSVKKNVKKKFYPIKECLEICQDEQVDLAVAVLHKRNGDYLMSLNTYLGIIELEIDPALMMKELTTL